MKETLAKFVISMKLARNKSTEDEAFSSHNFPQRHDIIIRVRRAPGHRATFHCKKIKEKIKRRRNFPGRWSDKSAHIINVCHCTFTQIEFINLNVEIRGGTAVLRGVNCAGQRAQLQTAENQ